MFSSDQIIKGERLQQLADVYFGFPEDFCYNPLISREPEKHCNIRSITSEYENPRIVFCYTYCISAFTQIIKYFKNRYILLKFKIILIF